MYLNNWNRSAFTKGFLIFGLSILLFFCGFFTNRWQVADQQWFVNFQHDSESYVVGRLVKSRQDGIFSDGGLIGLGRKDASDLKKNRNPIIYHYFQHLAYNKGLTFGVYKAYKSQIGGQGIFFSILDGLISMPPRDKLIFFNMLTSFFSAIILTAIILWFYLEFGLCIALFVLASTVFSQWLVVFGRNLYWSIWAFYLPMVVAMYYLKRNRVSANTQPIMFVILVFITVFIKCLFNGYEYITTTLIMMMVPFVYYSFLDRLNFFCIFKFFLSAMFGSCLAILLSLCILCFQIASVKGNFLDGVEYIAYSLKKRTHEDSRNFPSIYASSLESGTTTVVAKYLNGTFFDANNYLYSSNPFVSNWLFKLRYYYLISLFLIMSAFLYFRSKRYVAEKNRESCLALIFATWFSFLAPLSWFIVFKSHSYIHTHMNYIVWQMPFTFFGFAVCALVVKSFLPGRNFLTRRRT